MTYSLHRGTQLLGRVATLVPGAEISVFGGYLIVENGVEGLRSEIQMRVSIPDSQQTVVRMPIDAQTIEAPAPGPQRARVQGRRIDLRNLAPENLVSTRDTLHLQKDGQPVEIRSLCLQELRIDDPARLKQLLAPREALHRDSVWSVSIFPPGDSVGADL